MAVCVSDKCSTGECTVRSRSAVIVQLSVSSSVLLPIHLSHRSHERGKGEGMALKCMERCSSECVSSVWVWVSNPICLVLLVWCVLRSE